MLRKLVFALSAIGVGLSVYLLYARMNESHLICGVSSCSEVNESPYSVLLGIPISAWGVFFYAVMFVLALVKHYKLFFIGSVIGVLFSAYFMYLEFFVIYAWCQWCMLSAWITVALLIIAIRLRTIKNVDSTSG